MNCCLPSFDFRDRSTHAPVVSALSSASRILLGLPLRYLGKQAAFHRERCRTVTQANLRALQTTSFHQKALVKKITELFAWELLLHIKTSLSRLGQQGKVSLASLYADVMMGKTKMACLVKLGCWMRRS